MGNNSSLRHDFLFTSSIDSLTIFFAVGGQHE